MTDRIVSYVISIGQPLPLVSSQGAEVVQGGLLVYASRVRLAWAHVGFALMRPRCGNTLVLAAQRSVVANGKPERVRRRMRLLVQSASRVFADGVHALEEADRHAVSDAAMELRTLMRRARLPVALVHDALAELAKEPRVTTFTLVQAITWAAHRNEPEVRWKLERLAGAYLEREPWQRPAISR